MSGSRSAAPSIKGIFFAEFDNTIGPRIVFQVPAGCVPCLSRSCFPLE